MTTFFAGMIPTAQQIDDNALVGTVVCQLRQTGSVQSIPTGTTPTAITFNTEDYDLLGGHSTVTNPSRYTCQREGWYQVVGAFTLQGSPSGGSYIAVRWRLNSSDLPGSQVISARVTGQSTVCVARTYMVYLAVGDFVEMFVEHDVGASVNTSTASVQPCNMQLAYAGLPN